MPKIVITKSYSNYGNTVVTQQGYDGPEIAILTPKQSRVKKKLAISRYQRQQQIPRTSTSLTDESRMLCGKKTLTRREIFSLYKSKERNHLQSK